MKAAVQILFTLVLCACLSTQALASGETGPYSGPTTTDTLNIIASSSKPGVPGSIMALTEGGFWTNKGDGVNWTKITLPAGEDYFIESLIWSGERYVCTGATTDTERAVIFTCDDTPSAAWVERTPSGDFSLAVFHSVVAAPHELLAVGNNSRCYRSPDHGLTWSVVNVGVSGGLDLGFLIWAGTQYAVQEGGSLRFSTTGASWSAPAPLPANSAGPIRYLNGQFIITTSTYAFELANFGDTTLGILTSPDGITWTQRHSETFDFNFASPSTPSYVNASLFDVTWTGSQYVVIGYARAHNGGEPFASGVFTLSYASYTDEEYVWCSPDGLLWTRTSFPPPQNLPGPDHYFVTSNQERIYVTPNQHSGFSQLPPTPAPTYPNDPDYNAWVGGFVLPLFQRGYMDDPDHDGVINMLEYAYHTSPIAANDSSSAPRVEIEPGGQVAVFIYRTAVGTGWSWSVSRSSTMEEGSWDETGILDASYIPGDGYFLVRQRWNISSSPKAFFRATFNSP